VSRALGLVLSYRAQCSRQLNLPSLFLDERYCGAEPTSSSPAGADAAVADQPHRRERPVPYCGARRRSAHGLESFQQCPFQFLEGDLSRKEAPPRPEKRIDLRVQSIVHKVLGVVRQTGRIEPAVRQIFQSCGGRSIPCRASPVYRTGMRNDLRRFVRMNLAAGFPGAIEQVPFAGEGLRSRTHRPAEVEALDLSSTTYSKISKKLKSETPAGTPIFAVERFRPQAAMFYCIFVTK
jgi:hypothetical protein